MCMLRNIWDEEDSEWDREKHYFRKYGFSGRQLLAVRGIKARHPKIHRTLLNLTPSDSLWYDIDIADHDMAEHGYPASWLLE